jgi:hypothetical protein
LEGVLLGQVEQLKVLSECLELKVQVLHLDGHGLVVVDEGGLLLMIHPDLFHQILRSRPLILRLLTESQASVSLDQLAL